MGIYGRQILITIFVMVCQAACKPGSVRSDYSSRMLVTKHLLQPTQTTRWKYRCYINIASCFYLVLLPAGFTKLFQLPETRCALTTPFHPYFNIKRYIFCCTSLEFPLPGVTRRCISMEPGLSSLNYRAATQLPDKVKI